MDAKTVDEYIGLYPPSVRERLGELRALAAEVAPEAQEKISWQMPSYYIGTRPVIQFAAFKNHIGIYPGPEAIAAFADRLEGFKTTKGAVQLPYSKPVPLELVRDIMAFNLEARTE